MKTPIAVIKNYAELLKMEHITEEKRMEYSMAIETAAMRLSNLISNILKLNKLENQRLTLERQNFNVCNQLCECIVKKAISCCFNITQTQMKQKIKNRLL